MGRAGPRTAGILIGALVGAMVVMSPAWGVGSGGPGRASVTSRPLPKSPWFGSIVEVGNRLVLAGETPTGTADRQGACVAARLDPRTLVIGASTDTLCGTASGQRVGFVETLIDHNNVVQLTEVRAAPGTGRLSVGPVLTTFAECSGCGPQSTYGGGWLWIFDDGPDAQTPTVLQVSASSGRLVDSIPLAVPFSQPVMAANDEGLWLAPSPEGGWSGPQPPPAIVYRIAPGATAATAVLPGAADGCWMVAQGTTLWAGIGRQSSGCADQRVVRIDGTGPAPVFSTPDPYDPLMVVGGEGGLWTLVTGTGSDETTVVRIDPTTGLTTLEARVRALWTEDGYLDQGEAAASHGSLFVLGPPLVGQDARYRTLFRISPR